MNHNVCLEGWFKNQQLLTIFKCPITKFAKLTNSENSVFFRQIRRIRFIQCMHQNVCLILKGLLLTSCKSLKNIAFQNRRFKLHVIEREKLCFLKSLNCCVYCRCLLAVCTMLNKNTCMYQYKNKKINLRYSCS